MRILIVANHNTGSFSPFIVEQVDAVRQLGVEVDYYGIHGKGFGGYLSNLNALKSKIQNYNPDLIHAHYGLSGLLANFQRAIPVVTTYHGSDIHSKGLNLFLSRIAMRLSVYNIFVSEGLQKTASCHHREQCVLPCGVDFKNIYPIERSKARNLLGWSADGKYVLFSGSFDNDVKNSSLAKAATKLIGDVRLMELHGYSREQVNWAMNAANCLLMTSFREGSPQVVKEAMTCGTPVVSVPVGDVAEVTAGIKGCYMTSYDPNEIAEGLRKALSFNGNTQGRDKIIEREFDNATIAQKLLSIYQSVK